MIHSLFVHFKFLGVTPPPLSKSFCAKDVMESPVVAGAVSL